MPHIPTPEEALRRARNADSEAMAEALQAIASELKGIRQELGKINENIRLIRTGQKYDPWGN